MAPACARSASPHAPPAQARASGPKRPYSNYRGLTWDRQDGKWRVRINIASKQWHVGRYRDELSAAQAYDRMAVLVIGPHAATNFPAGQALAETAPLSAPMISLLKRFKPGWREQDQLPGSASPSDVSGGDGSASMGAAEQAGSPLAPPPSQQYSMHGAKRPLAQLGGDCDTEDDCHGGTDYLYDTAEEMECTGAVSGGLRFNGHTLQPQPQHGYAATAKRMRCEPAPPQNPFPLYAAPCNAHAMPPVTSGYAAAPHHPVTAGEGALLTSSPLLVGGACGAGPVHSAHEPLEGLGWIEEWLVAEEELQATSGPAVSSLLAPPLLAPPLLEPGFGGMEWGAGGAQAASTSGDCSIATADGGVLGTDALHRLPARASAELAASSGGATGEQLDELYAGIGMTRVGSACDAAHFGAPPLTAAMRHCTSAPDLASPLYESAQPPRGQPALAPVQGMLPVGAGAAQPPSLLRSVAAAAAAAASGADTTVGAASRFVDVINTMVASHGMAEGSGAHAPGCEPAAAEGEAAAMVQGDELPGSPMPSDSDMGVVAALLLDLLSSGRPMQLQGERHLSMSLMDMKLPALQGMPGCRLQVTLNLARDAA